MKTALITGVNGQDGSYLADLLIEKGYRVYGMETPNSDRTNTNHLNNHDQFQYVTGTLTCENSIENCFHIAWPTEVYNFGALSSVGASFDNPLETMNINAGGVVRLLEMIRRWDSSIKIYQASSSEMYGNVNFVNEQTKFDPKSPYAVSKCAAHMSVKNYRETYGMFGCSGILFNHESERRGTQFVTRKITRGVAEIALGLRDFIELGNIDIHRDWGYAPDYIDAIYRMMQRDTPDDYIICAGETRSLKEFIANAFWAIDIVDWHNYITQEPSLFRPSDLAGATGDNSKAKTILNWESTTDFPIWVHNMVKNDIKILEKTL